MIKSLFWGLWIVLGTVACSSQSSEKYVRYTVFPEEIELVSEEIRLDTALFRYPFRVKVYQDMAIVLDLHNMDHYLHAFTYPGWQHIVSFGKRGNGPEELLSAETFQFNSPDSIWVLDANKMKITRWNIDKETCSANKEEEILLDKGLIRTLDFKEIPTGFIAPDYTGEYRFHRLDREGKILQSGGVIPTENIESDHSIPLAQAWRSFIDYQPESHAIVLVTQLGEVIEVLNPDDETSKVVYGLWGEPQFESHQGEGIPTGIMGFSDIQIVDDLIYTVFHGVTFKEIEKQMREKGEMEDGGRTIHVFDFDGNPVKKYFLDRPVYGIYVDTETQIIIATDVNSNHSIVKFNI